MAIVSKAVLKTYFEDGKEPDENKFINLIDTLWEEGGGGVTDHGALTGLGDDDHEQYLLANGSRIVSGDFTISGTLIVGEGTAYAAIRLKGSAASTSDLMWYSGNDIAGILRRDTNDDLIWMRYNPAGTYVDAPLILHSSTGNLIIRKQVFIDEDVRVGGGLYVGSTLVNPTDGEIHTTGPIYINSPGTGAGLLGILGAAGQNRRVRFHTGSLARWDIIGADTGAEGGGNAGSDFGIHSYDDGGNWLECVLKFTRSTGNLWLGGDVEIDGAFQVDGAGTIDGDVKFAGDVLEATMRIEGSRQYKHLSWPYHFDGGDKDLLQGTHGFLFRTHGAFTAPSSYAEAGSLLYLPLSVMGANSQCFFCKNHGASHQVFTSAFLGISVPFETGVRWDDGTDNNYVEIFYQSKYIGSWIQSVLFSRKRIQAGSVVTVQLMAPVVNGPLPPVQCIVEGTKWSSWGIRPLLDDIGNYRWLTSVTPLAFTPTMSGLFFRNAGAATSAWQWMAIEAYNYA